MSFERMPVGTGIGAEPGISPLPGASEEGGGDSGAPTTQAVRLQILATEHWGLLATRSLAWNESFSRAGMFLSTLSGAIVALALVAQASAFGREFAVFALVILPVVLFIGLTTFIRLGASNSYDAQCVIGMNRIRAAYLEMAPDVERYLVMSANDDRRGIGISMGIQPGRNFLVHLLAATPSVISVLNSVIVAAIVAIAALEVGATTVPALAFGALSFAASLAAHQVSARRTIGREMDIADAHVLFPTDEAD